MRNQHKTQATAPAAENALATTAIAMRPMVPAKDFETSRRFYEELGFRPGTLADRLVEMHLGAYSFILQDYYVGQWADNFVFHLRVSDVNLWWNRIESLKLAERYGIRRNRRVRKAGEWSPALLIHRACSGELQGRIHRRLVEFFEISPSVVDHIGAPLAFSGVNRVYTAQRFQRWP